MKRTIVSLILMLATVSSILVFTDKIIRSQEESSDITAIEGKIDDLLKGQKEIVQQIELIKSELEIIKIRVTQRV